MSPLYDNGQYDAAKEYALRLGPLYRLDDGHPGLKADYDFLVHFLSKSPEQFSRIADELKHDEGFVHQILRQNSMLYKELSKPLQNKIAIGLSALHDVNADIIIPLFPYEWRDDISFMTYAVAQNPASLRFGSLRVQNQVVIALAAIKNNPTSIFYVSPNLFNDSHFREEASVLNPDVKNILLQTDVDDQFKASKRKVVFESLSTRWPTDLQQEIGPDLCADKTFVQELIQFRKDYFGFIPSPENTILQNFSFALCEDFETVLNAVKNNPYEVRFAGKMLKRNPEIIKATLKNYYCVDFLEEKYVTEDILIDLILEKSFADPILALTQMQLLAAQQLVKEFSTKINKDIRTITKILFHTKDLEVEAELLNFCAFKKACHIHADLKQQKEQKTKTFHKKHILAKTTISAPKTTSKHRL